MYSDKGVICATIEARMTSSRLPGKVLLDVLGKPVLQHIVERLRRSGYIDEIVVATTINKEDDSIVELCDKINCKYYRGSEEDVLLRVLDAAKSVNAETIVEITADCPVVDWRHADKLIELFFSDKYDYVSNTIMRTFPDGFDVQVFSVKVLEEVNGLTKRMEDREHVSLYIYSHPEKFSLLNWGADSSMNFPEMAVTLDTEEDYQLIKIIYEDLYFSNEDFSAEEVVEFLVKNSEYLKINQEIIRKVPLREE